MFARAFEAAVEQCLVDTFEDMATRRKALVADDVVVLQEASDLARAPAE